MPITKPLPELTLRELLEAAQDQRIRDAAQLLGAAARDFGLPIVFTAAPGADVTDRPRRQLGEALDEWRGHVVSGRAFAGSDRVSPTLGNVGGVILLNPLGSGVDLLVHRIIICPETTDQYVIHDRDTAGAAPTSPAGNLDIRGPLTAVTFDRYDGGLPVVTHHYFRAHLNAGQPYILQEPGGVLFRLRGDDAINTGLIVRASGADSIFVGSIEWAEVPR